MSDPRHASAADDTHDDELAGLRRRNAELGVLHETIHDLTSTLSLSEVLDRLLERSLRHLETEIGSILLVGPDSRLRVVASRGLPDALAEEIEMELGEGISGYVAMDGHPLLVDDIEEDTRFQRRNHERYYTRSFISSPLKTQGQVLGVLNVNNKRSREAFSASDLRLLEAIAGHAAIALSNARRYEETLHRAQLDGLTGLANHGHFFQALGTELERARRYDRDLTIVMVDIDQFKEYNERFGHGAGDDALVRIAGAIAGISRIHDLVARFGGEEFVVVLPETALDGALHFAEKIRRAVESTGFGPDGTEQLTVSVGVAGLDDHTDPGDLVKAADALVVAAKSAGRNRVNTSRSSR
jgi:diguanylate cyclase (GGDEF)-like protein